jgi:hypothetical protein
MISDGPMTRGSGGTEVAFFYAKLCQILAKRRARQVFGIVGFAFRICIIGAREEDIG